MKYHKLSESQMLIWTGQQLNPESPQYNMAFAFEFKNELDIDHFKIAFSRLVKEIDVLRGVFVNVDGQPQMVFRDQIAYDFPLLKLNTIEGRKWMENRCRQPFELEERVFETAIIQHGEDHYTWYINQHHLITDGWSLALLYNRQLQIYLELNAQHPNSFYEYLESLEKDSISTQKKYWNQLSEQLPDPKPFQNRSNFEGIPESTRVEYKMKPDQIKRLEELIQDAALRTWSSDLGKFVFFLTVLAATIHKLNHQNEIAIGVPSSNRLNRGEKNTVGLFIEMYPILCEIASDDTFRTLYKKLHMQANGFLKNAKTGLSTPALNKSFNAVLNYINAKLENFEGINMNSEWLHPGASDPGHFIRIQVTSFDHAEDIKLLFDLNSHIFNTQSKSYFIETFLINFEKFLHNKDEQIYPEAIQERKLIAEVNNTQQEFPKDQTVLDMLDLMVVQYPEKVAVSFKDEKLTFQQLDQKSNQLAHYLQEHSGNSGKPVGILMERSNEMLVAILGVIKSGVPYVPIDPDYPKERIDYILNDAAIEIVVQKETIKQSASFSLKKLDAYPQPNDLIYIIYTSGSTGKPKGVMNEHRGVFNRLFWASKEFDLSYNDAVLQKTNFTFDVSVGELFLPLFSGCRLVMADPKGHKDSDYLKKIIEKEKITSIHFVPPMLEVFLLNLQRGDCPSLKYILCSGEALLNSQVDSCREKLPHVSIYNLYGPTEAAIEVTKWSLPAYEKRTSKVTIGQPISNVKIRIVDKELQDCTFNRPGELWIGGIQVARGYNNLEQLTADRFVEHEGLRWYKTGDLCQWLNTGEIEYLGRLDSQVKVRGFRVELGEIEEVLKQHGEVEDAAVLYDGQLIAFVCVKNPLDYATYLSKSLPEYMIPTSFIEVDKIPWMNNGKIDRQKLLAINRKQAVTNTPQDEFQEFVHKIWVEVLREDEVDIKTNFFNIGGDSLSGIRVITSINAELDLEIPVVAIFQHNTIEKLAVHIEQEIDKRLAET